MTKKKDDNTKGQPVRKKDSTDFSEKSNAKKTTPTGNTGTRSTDKDKSKKQ